MNRRLFFNRCATFVAGCVFALKLNTIEKILVELPKEEITNINLAWVNAPYEVKFIFNHDFNKEELTPIVIRRSQDLPFSNEIKEACPIRLNEEGNPIPPYIKYIC